MQQKFTVTATGQTDAIKLNPDSQLSFAATGDVDDYTLTAQVQLVDDRFTPNWYDVQAITDGEVYATVAGARKLRFNLSDLGTATTIDIEVTGAKL